MMNRIRKRLDSVLEWILVALMSLMVLNVLWQVFSRYILGDPSSYTDELARYLLVWVGTLGAAYVAGKNQHLAIDLLPNSLSGKRKQWLNTFIYLLIALFALLVLVIGGANLMLITMSLGQVSAALNLPLWVLYVILPFSGMVMLVYCVLNIVDSWELS